MYSPPIKFVVVDDEVLDRLTLRSLAAGHPRLQCVGEYDNALDAFNGIKSLQPQLVFLDIEMPEITGLQLLKTIREDVPLVVFITSHPEFALEGFELSALDYILKPLTEVRFIQCMNRVYEYWEMKTKASAYDIMVEQDTLVIKQGHDKLRLPLHEVIYLEAMNDYTKLVTTGKNFISLGTLGQFLMQMPAKHFIRIHRSYAVAAAKITRVKRRELLCGDLTLPIGLTYRPALDELYS